MSKKIIVTEKPSVARTFAKVLGVTNKETGYFENNEWIITWCLGHLVTMSFPEVYDEELKKWSYDTLPFLPGTYKYEVISENKEQFNIIKKLYNRSDVEAIYYAGDAAREGLYIQMLVRKMAFANKPSLTEKVVWIDSQTDTEIKRGIKEAKPLTEYKNLSDAGFLRAIEDYSVGINLTRVFSLKYGRAYGLKKPMAVGRVMTCVLSMIVEREREIRNFVSQSFYKIAAVNESATFMWKANPKSAIYPKIEPYLYDETGFKDEKMANTFKSGLGPNLIIKEVTEKTEKKYAPLLYNLAELQNDCSKKFKISPDATLDIAEKLYMAGIITYPRTDARVLSSAIADEIHINLNGIKNRGDNAKFVDSIKDPHAIKNTRYTDDSKISDHYALIPTGQNLKALDSMDEKDKKVYDLIEKRFLAIFMPPAVYKKTQVKAIDDKRSEEFFLTGSVLIDEGFMAVAGKEASEEEISFSFKEGDIVPVNYETVKGETKPKPRYTSGSIILAMENAGKLIEDEELREQIKAQGIGTSATRAEILKKLVSINNVSLNGKTQILTPTLLGELVYDTVKDCVPDLTSPEMTAQWERDLEHVAEGRLARADYQKHIETYVTDNVALIIDKTVGSNLIEFAKKVIKEMGLDSTSKEKKSVKAADVATYLRVPFEDKEKVKLLGARWDGDKKLWYIPKGLKTEPFAEYIFSDKAITSIKKIFLKVPFDDKDKAKKLGARWDGDKKQWYITNTMDTKEFSAWMK